jgi:hypothetical protein
VGVGVTVAVGARVGVGLGVALAAGVDVLVAEGVGERLDPASLARLESVGRKVGLGGALRWQARRITRLNPRVNPKPWIVLRIAAIMLRSLKTVNFETEVSLYKFWKLLYNLRVRRQRLVSFLFIKLPRPPGRGILFNLLRLTRW